MLHANEIDIISDDDRVLKLLKNYYKHTKTRIKVRKNVNKLLENLDESREIAIIHTGATFCIYDLLLDMSLRKNGSVPIRIYSYFDKEQLNIDSTICEQLNILEIDSFNKLKLYKRQ